MRNIVKSAFVRCLHHLHRRHGPLVHSRPHLRRARRGHRHHALAARRRLGPVRPAGILVYRGGHRAIELPRTHRRVRPDGPSGARPVRRARRLVPLDNIGAWVSFVAIYLVTLAAITAGYTIYYRRTAGSFDAALAATAKAGKSRPSRREAITSVLVRAFPARKAECADLVGNPGTYQRLEGSYSQLLYCSTLISTAFFNPGR